MRESHCWRVLIPMASTKGPKTSENPPTTTTSSTSGNETPPSSSSSSLSAETIANNLDLLIEILVCLPIRSLIRFKSVSKQWLSLISDPHFCSRRTSQTPPFHSPASGLILVSPNSVSGLKDYEFANLCKLSCPSFRNLFDAIILQSCNGLFLLICIPCSDTPINYCVYNPTTKSCTILPSPPPVPSSTSRYTCYYNLAFDPSKSPHYRVVCVRECKDEDSSTISNIRFQILESKTASWWLSDCGFSCDTSSGRLLHFAGGTFWNNSIHWMDSRTGGLYFNVDEEYVREIPMPEESRNWSTMYARFGYFGVSGDHLHLVGICKPSWPKLNVYEMKRDYSGWFVKFRVDLDEVPNPFPEMIQQNFPRSWCRIICVVRGELEDDESYLVLQIPGKIVRYYLNTKTLEVLKHLNASFRSFKGYQFIESLACV